MKNVFQSHLIDKMCYIPADTGHKFNAHKTFNTCLCLRGY